MAILLLFRISNSLLTLGKLLSSFSLVGGDSVLLLESLTLRSFNNLFIPKSNEISFADVFE